MFNIHNNKLSIQLNHCLESCYWHLIEKRFCYDESIALYEEPEKGEKNNNMFDNMAFFDSVAVIAGRSIVTIDKLPEEKEIIDKPIVQQPTKRVQLREDKHLGVLKTEYFSRSVPLLIFERTLSEEDISKSDNAINLNTDIKEEESNETQIHESNQESKQEGTKTGEEDKENSECDDKTSDLKPPEEQLLRKRKSLLERRTSKSLYLKIDAHKEIPIIRQSSMPKFYLDTPQSNQAESSIFRSPSTTLANPVTPSGFVFDLYSVVQMEKCRCLEATAEVVPVHRDDRASKILQLRDKIKLRRVKSSLAGLTLPHHTHHM